MKKLSLLSLSPTILNKRKHLHKSNLLILTGEDFDLHVQEHSWRAVSSIASTPGLQLPKSHSQGNSRTLLECVLDERDKVEEQRSEEGETEVGLGVDEEEKRGDDDSDCDWRLGCICVHVTYPNPRSPWNQASHEEYACTVKRALYCTTWMYSQRNKWTDRVRLLIYDVNAPAKRINAPFEFSFFWFCRAVT